MEEKPQLQKDSLSALSKDFSTNGTEGQKLLKIRRFEIDSFFNLVDFKKYHRGAHGHPLLQSPLINPVHISGRDKFKLFNHGHGFYCYYFFQRHYGRIKNISGYPSREDFQIITALKRSFDENTEFLDMEETTVEITCRIKDPQLQKLNIIGKNLDTISSILGKPIYAHEEFVMFGGPLQFLSLQLQNDTIIAFKYNFLETTDTSISD